MVQAAEEQDFWDGVSEGYAEVRRANHDVVVHDDYPEHAHLRLGDVPAAGAHNEERGTTEFVAPEKGDGVSARANRRVEVRFGFEPVVL